MFKKVLIANRGEIAERIIRALRKLEIASVAVYSDADRFSRPTLMADEAARLGPAPARDSYLNVDAVVAACIKTGADAVHPGYGFLSENAEFAERLAAVGVAFIGPRPEHLRDFGLKHTARALARAASVPLLEGSGLLESADEAIAAANAVGFPVMLKSTAGGGGIGMQLCRDADELRGRFEAIRRMAGASFGDARVYLERFVGEGRHVEVQIFGDGRGRVVALGERDCSLQRRNQKVIEETPAPNMPDDVRERLHAAAVALGELVAYESAGTVEFIYDVARNDFSFLEVNTRLQVEHPVTEAVFGVDLVEWMIRQAAGEFELPPQSELRPRGAAIEARIYAEVPQADFRPSAGRLTSVRFPENARVDRWIETGADVTAWYDPMLAKLIVHGSDREDALVRLRAALADTELLGLETNLDYLRAIAVSDLLASGAFTTTALKDFDFTPRAIDVISPGAQSSLQDWPGRLGLWNVGVPPSGPMDERSFRLANVIAGNSEGTVALECAVSGPTLKFHADATIALAGAQMKASLDGHPVPWFEPVAIPAGATLSLGAIEGAGLRTYLAVRGGFEAAQAFGSNATFMLGGFGGHGSGALRAGDTLKLAGAQTRSEPRAAADHERPKLTNAWTIGVRSGPHGAPDFFQDADIVDLFTATYEVHFNSDRTGVRLIGPRPRWARKDGGEAGLHPSNLHDNAYAVGALDFTGDMPIILGPDGPSLGGFVCPVVVARDEMWKTGQLKPGDEVRFTPHGLAAPNIQRAADLDSPILRTREDGPCRVVYRRAGDDNLLVEYGPMSLDIALRLRAHALSEAVASLKLEGVVDLTPGIRSLQVHFDSKTLSADRVLDALSEIEPSLPAPEDMSVPSRTVRLPLAWNHSQIRLAMRKYQELVRPDAPWCPDNIEFIRRINGLESLDDVRRTVFEADYLVLGLGDVYLGAPVATPIDPRHRLVTTKYNPARTWTPENAVGIGGAYLCVYGMEGPGGYQLFGRTIQMWNSWRRPAAFGDEPFLLRFFDRIKFFPVEEAELEDAREAFPHGRYDVAIEDGTFSYADHAAFLARERDSISAFEAARGAAFNTERADWKARGIDSFVSDAGPAADAEATLVPDGCVAAPSPMTGNVWKIAVEAGQRVAAGDPLVIVEAMKMEIAVPAPCAGEIVEIRAAPGRTVRSGDTVAVIRAEN